ncbi:DUF4129 domain-containing protein [Flavobacterium sp. JP2137]|uniref:DUF4129 domain-containing protein n=1 Tax=Flavobacterium sp. JP2137 TaxID=3414510 RepID=UPI003D30114C
MNKTVFAICLFLQLSFSYAVSLPTVKAKAAVAVIQIDSDSAMVQEKFATDFKAKYASQPEFHYATAADSDNLWTRFKNKITRWLNAFFDVKVGEKPYTVWNKAWNYLSVIVLVLLIAYIIRAFMRKDALWFFKKSKKALAVHPLEVEKDLIKADFKSLIEQALREEHHRLAIRYYYLWLLKILAQREIISWDIEKTNSDYVAEIRNGETRKSFQYLSYLYNNIWYGEFDVDPVAFEKAVQAFNAFLKPWKDE